MNRGSRRACIAVKDARKDGIWTLAIARKLVTNSEFDVQFRDTKTEYAFRVAIFDNALQCQACRKPFTLFMPIAERKAATVRCPGCGTATLEPVMQVFFAKTDKKS